MNFSLSVWHKNEIGTVFSLSGNFIITITVVLCQLINIVIRQFKARENGTHTAVYERLLYNLYHDTTYTHYT